MRKDFRYALLVCLTAIALAPVAGCENTPSFDILGSYFPAWLVCILIGIVLCAVTGLYLSESGHGALIRWSIFTYPALAACVAFTLWLVLFG
jgi:YtcA family